LISETNQLALLIIGICAIAGCINPAVMGGCAIGLSIPTLLLNMCRLGKSQQVFKLLTAITCIVMGALALAGSVSAVTVGWVVVVPVIVGLGVTALVCACAAPVFCCNFLDAGR